MKLGVELITFNCITYKWLTFKVKLLDFYRKILNFYVDIKSQRRNLSKTSFKDPNYFS